MLGTTDQYLARLSAADRKLLQLSVQMNPILVANVDGCFSLSESSAVTDAIRALKDEPEYRPLLLLAGHEEISEAALRVMLEEHTKDIDAYLEQIAELLECVPNAVADAYRRFTLFAVIHVAEASRSSLFGLVGARISESEKAMIRAMIDGLGLTPNEAERAKLDM